MNRPVGAQDRTLLQPRTNRPIGQRYSSKQNLFPILLRKETFVICWKLTIHWLKSIQDTNPKSGQSCTKHHLVWHSEVSTRSHKGRRDVENRKVSLGSWRIKERFVTACRPGDGKANQSLSTIRKDNLMSVYLLLRYLSFLTKILHLNEATPSTR